jgi:NADPH-dependent 2,4-dienoyl-CoA reductase/sulfur reductase-like enzyme
MTQTDIAVVGAGPAGLGAAIAARRQGARVLVVDAFAAPGGQYWMQPASPGNAQAREGAARIGEARSLGVDFLTGAELWAAWPGFRLGCVVDGAGREVRAKSLVIATGAHDRPVAFPGWTLPGVMTPGAAQRLLKLDGTSPGRRVVLAGSGPFLLVVAGQLRAAGVEVAALVEAARPGRSLLRALAFPERFPEMAALLRGVAGLPVRFGAVVAAAQGQDRVERVALARWPGLAPAGTVEDVDALLVGYGFRPQVDLSTLLGCRHAHDAAKGGWHVVADPLTGATSVAGVFAAGEVTGVAGARPAWLGGLAAGSAAAASLGFGAAVAPAGLTRARRFAAWLGAVWPPARGLGALAGDATILCRCEDVTRADLLAAVADGASTAAAVKMWTRCGMGPCQGRICGAPLADALEQAAGLDPAAVGRNEARIPLRPVPVEVVAEVAGRLPDGVPALSSQG